MCGHVTDRKEWRRAKFSPSFERAATHFGSSRDRGFSFGSKTNASLSCCKRVWWVNMHVRRESRSRVWWATLSRTRAVREGTRRLYPCMVKLGHTMTRTSSCENLEHASAEASLKKFAHPTTRSWRSVVEIGEVESTLRCLSESIDPQIAISESRKFDTECSRIQIGLVPKLIVEDSKYCAKTTRTATNEGELNDSEESASRIARRSSLGTETSDSPKIVQHTLLRLLKDFQ